MIPPGPLDAGPLDVVLVLVGAVLVGAVLLVMILAVAAAACVLVAAVIGWARLVAGRWRRLPPVPDYATGPEGIVPEPGGGGDVRS